MWESIETKMPPHTSLEYAWGGCMCGWHPHRQDSHMLSCLQPRRCLCFDVVSGSPARLHWRLPPGITIDGLTITRDKEAVKRFYCSCAMKWISANCTVKQRDYLGYDWSPVMSPDELSSSSINSVTLMLKKRANTSKLFTLAIYSGLR